MRYQAVFSFYGDKIHAPVEANSKEQARATAFEENPMMQRKGVTVSIRELVEGEQAIDDREILKFQPPSPS